MMLNKIQSFIVFLTRVAMGWLFLYAGVTKVMDDTWTAAGYIKDVQVFPTFFAWCASPAILPYVDFLNKWGLVLIGVSLIIGLFVRWSSLAGILLMALYYLPVLDFPHVGTHSYIVDEHVIYALVLALLVVFRAGGVWGMDRKIYHHY